MGKECGHCQPDNTTYYSQNCSQEKQQKNAYETARRGGLLYEKFASLLTDLKVLGDRLDSSQKAYHEVVKKVHEGRGNLISQVEELKELGAKTKM
jgi:DNA recombination protein RmuC